MNLLFRKPNLLLVKFGALVEESCYSLLQFVIVGYVMMVRYKNCALVKSRAARCVVSLLKICQQRLIYGCSGTFGSQATGDEQ